MCWAGRPRVQPVNIMTPNRLYDTQRALTTKGLLTSKSYDLIWLNLRADTEVSKYPRRYCPYRFPKYARITSHFAISQGRSSLGPVRHYNPRSAISHPVVRAVFCGFHMRRTAFKRCLLLSHGSSYLKVASIFCARIEHRHLKHFVTWMLIIDTLFCGSVNLAVVKNNGY